jgi:hypothetical protein
MLPEQSRNPASRVSDRDRDRYVAVLRMHCTEGLLTLDEFSDRVGAVFAATTAGELELTVRDLPLPWEDPPAFLDAPGERDRRRRPVRWLIAIFGSSGQRGRYRLDDESNAVAIFGDCMFDLSDAMIEGPNPIINAVAVFGDVKIIVPEGIDVELDGLSVFGTKRCETSGASIVPGSPVIRVRALAVFGDVRVRTTRNTGRRPGRSWRGSR